MAKQGIVTTAQDTIVDTAKAGATGVRSLAGSVADAAAKMATGTVLKAVKGARRLVRGKPVKRKVKRAKTTARRKVKSASRRVARTAKKSPRRTVARRKK